VGPETLNAVLVCPIQEADLVRVKEHHKVHKRVGKGDLKKYIEDIEMKPLCCSSKDHLDPPWSLTQ